MEKGLINSFKSIGIIDGLIIIYFLFLVIFPSVSIVAFILLTVYVVVSGKFINSFKIIKSDPGLVIFVGFFLIHLIGMLYTENTVYGWNDIQTKLSFLLMPIVFTGLTINEKRFEEIKRTFILMAVFSLIVFLIIALVNYLKNSDSTIFFYTHFAWQAHTTYVTIYLNLAMLFIQERVIKNNWKWSAINLCAFFILFIGILLLSARMPTFVTFITLAIYPLIFYGRQFWKEKRWLSHGVILTVMIILFFGFLQFNNRYAQVENEIVMTHTEKITEEPNSTNIRFHLWRNAIQLIGRNPVLGVGTGDVKDELGKIYKENNYEYGAKAKMNPHNQFLHTGVVLGIIGLIVLSLLLFYPMQLAFRKKDWLYFIFLVIIFLNCMTESILERQAGILFFAAFNTCFYLKNKSQVSS